MVIMIANTSETCYSASMEKQERVIATEYLHPTLGELGIRQDWLARQVGLSAPQLNRVLLGKRTTSRTTAEQVCALLRVPFFVAWKLPNGSTLTRSNSSEDEEAA